MRRLCVGLLFAVVVGLGVASVAAATPAVNETRDNPQTQTAVAVQRVNVPAAGIRDEAAMVLVGTALIGLAAAVRRAA